MIISYLKHVAAVAASARKPSETLEHPEHGKVSTCREMIHRGELRRHRATEPPTEPVQWPVGRWAMDLRTSDGQEQLARCKPGSCAASTLILKHSHYDHIMITL